MMSAKSNLLLVSIENTRQRSQLKKCIFILEPVNQIVEIEEETETTEVPENPIILNEEASGTNFNLTKNYKLLA